MALFGFMDILIFVKWTTDWAAIETEYNKGKSVGDEGWYNPGEAAPMII